MSFDRERYRDLYPWESHWLDVGGARMHYLDEGEGSTVVMVHGNPTWSFYFRRLVAELSRDHRVLVPDHIGCGLSDKPTDGEYEYTLDRRVADLGLLLDEVAPTGPLTFIVHDWGGMIGLSAALDRADRVARVVALNTAAFTLPAAARLPWRLWMVRNLPGFGALMVRGLNAFARSATWMATHKGLDHRIARALVAPYDSWRNRIATLRFVQDIPLHPDDRAWARCKKTEDELTVLADRPVLVCWGRHDFVFDDAFLDEWRRRLPDAEVHVYEDAGHYVLEDAADEVVAAVRAFVDAHPIAQPSSV
jgi:haloalkane dehalogenase